MINTNHRGKWGEDIALDYLDKKGYSKVATRFRSRFGEIDIIVKNKEFLVFCEVKTRKNAAFAQAREYVSTSKQKKIVSTAKYWLMKKPTSLQPRFDVVEVYAKDGELTSSPEIVHIENAF